MSTNLTNAGLILIMGGILFSAPPIAAMGMMGSNNGTPSTIMPTMVPATVPTAAPITSIPVTPVPKSSASSSFVADLEINLQAKPAQVQLLPGKATNVLTYQAEPVEGVESIPGSYLGPIIHAKTGQHVRVSFTNNLSQDSVIHWHGLHVPSNMDGHPRDAVGPGQSYSYEFEVKNRAGTYWFHPHPDGHSGEQVYKGLAGLVLVSDAEEAAAGLPSGAQDIPLVLQDRNIDANNQFAYPANMMTNMAGVFGNRMLVNGYPNLLLPVATRAYRFRVLNGSNARIYKLAWGNGKPMNVIGTDGGLLAQPVTRNYVMLAPGERVEILADFSKEKLNSTIALKSLSFSGGGMMGGSKLANGAAFPVMKFKVATKVEETFALPTTLSKVNRYVLGDAVNAANPRTIKLSHNMDRWLINGRTFEMDSVASDEIVHLNTIEAWDFVNQASGSGMMGGGMSLPHPMHIHGVQFQVLNRSIAAGQLAAWNSVKAGYVDEGWKDTVLVMPGEKVRVMMRFEDYEGLFAYHCHNLEHDDMGMMRNYQIIP